MQGWVPRAYLHNGSIEEIDDCCPVKANLDLERFKNIKIKFEPSNNLVHDGYPCTNICRSNK